MYGFTGGAGYDGVATRHVGKGVFGEEEEGMDVGVKGLEPLFSYHFIFLVSLCSYRGLKRGGMRMGVGWKEKRTRSTRQSSPSSSRKHDSTPRC
jgi:hypothetical protein